MRTALDHPRQPLRLHLIKQRLLLLLVGVVPEQPSLEGGARAAEAVGTAAAAQMGSEDIMALTQRYASRGMVGRSAGGEVGAFETEQHGSAIVAIHRGVMKGCALLVIPCIDRCSCFHQYATDLDMPICCSVMQGRVLKGILCPNRCACFDECATDISMPLLRSEMEGRGLLGILCLDHCSCFDEHATDFSMPVCRSDMEGRGLLGILCLDRCSCFDEHTTDISMPP
jgi:hypothetical protein